MRGMNRTLGAIVMGLFGIGAVACAPVDEIDMAVDCANLCDRYRDCFDSDYDTGACRDRCHEMVDRDPRVANECDTCLDSRACSESFSCADECSGLIP